MADLRTRIVAVQADHVEGQLTNYDDDGREECGCGHQGNATYREHLADAVIRELNADYILVPKGHTIVRWRSPDYSPESVFQNFEVIPWKEPTMSDEYVECGHQWVDKTHRTVNRREAWYGREQDQQFGTPVLATDDD